MVWLCDCGVVVVVVWLCVCGGCMVVMWRAVFLDVLCGGDVCVSVAFGVLNYSCVRCCMVVCWCLYSCVIVWCVFVCCAVRCAVCGARW